MLARSSDVVRDVWLGSGFHSARRRAWWLGPLDCGLEMELGFDPAPAGTALHCRADVPNPAGRIGRLPPCTSSAFAVASRCAEPVRWDVSGRNE